MKAHKLGDCRQKRFQKQASVNYSCILMKRQYIESVEGAGNALLALHLIRFPLKYFRERGYNHY